MKKLLNKNFVLAILMLLASLVTTYSLKAQQFLRPDSLRFGDSASYYETVPYGPIYLEISDSTGTGAALRNDTVFAYYVTWTGDTVKGTWQREKTNSRDTILVPGNGKTGVWKLLDTESPKGIKIVRTNDSATVNMKMTKVTLYGVKRLYNNIQKFRDPLLAAATNEKPFFLRNKYHKPVNLEYSSKDFRPDKIFLHDKLYFFDKMRW
jgi:hypothetical protein